MKEGVGNWQVIKTDKKVQHGDPKNWEPDVTDTYYDIMKDGKKVGELSHDDYFGYVKGNLFGRPLPDISGYGQASGAGPLGNLHAFLKSNTGKKWLGVLKENTMKREQLKTLIKEVIKMMNEYTTTIKDPETGEEMDIEVDYDYYHGSRGRRVGMARFAEPDEPAQVVINSVSTPDGKTIDGDDLDDQTREQLEDEIMDYHQGF